MKFKFTWGKKLIAGILLAAVVVGGTAAPAEAASKNHTAVVAQDNYRKTLRSEEHTSELQSQR